jgi:ATP-dependent DNA helicase PIF1
MEISVRSPPRPALCTQLQSGAAQTALMLFLAQLPPVVTEHMAVTFLFAFQTEVWKAADFAIVQLITGHRMDENDPLMGVLREMRVGNPMSAVSLAVLKRLSERKEELPHFVGTRAAANARNLLELDSLPGEAVRFLAQDEGDPAIIPHLDKEVQARDELLLKIWARVMLLQNQSLTLFNGSFGHIVSLAPLTVQWDNGTRTEVQPKTFSLDWGARQATRTQIPLLLAWATTIHKSQGQGYARGSVDLEGCRAHGQVYTALSRFESEEFLSLKNFDKCRPHMHEAVLEFYRGLEPV